MNKLRITLGGLLTISVVLLVAATSSASFVPAFVSAEITSSEILDSPVRDEFPEDNSRNLSLTQIFQQSESGIVSIAVTQYSNIHSSGVGSGFVYDNTGNIITNNHVVENAEKIIVTFIDGRSYNAEIVGNDKYSDLAVIKIDAKEPTLLPLKIGNSDLK